MGCMNKSTPAKRGTVRRVGRFIKYGFRAWKHERNQKKADEFAKIANASKDLFHKRLRKSQMLQEEIIEKRSEIKQLIALSRMLQQFGTERRVKFHISRAMGEIGRLREEERELREELRENDMQVANMALRRVIHNPPPKKKE